MNRSSTQAMSSVSGHKPCAGDSGRLNVTARWVIGVALLCACSQRTVSAEQPVVSSEPVSKTFAAKAAGSVVNPALDDSPLDDHDGDIDLRRGYGIADMRLNGCVKRQNDDTVSGSGCPVGFVVYGPYVPVPADSEIDVSFDVRPSKDILVYADIVSQMGARTLAGLNRQRIAAGQLQRVGYRVHIFNADVNVESRIGMDAEPGANVEISNVTMSVR